MVRFTDDATTCTKPNTVTSHQLFHLLVLYLNGLAPMTLLVNPQPRSLIFYHGNIYLTINTKYTEANSANTMQLPSAPPKFLHSFGKLNIFLLLKTENAITANLII